MASLLDVERSRMVREVAQLQVALRRVSEERDTWRRSSDDYRQAARRSADVIEAYEACLERIWSEIEKCRREQLDINDFRQRWLLYLLDHAEDAAEACFRCWESREYDRGQLCGECAAARAESLQLDEAEERALSKEGGAA